MLFRSRHCCCCCWRCLRAFISLCGRVALARVLSPACRCARSSRALLSPSGPLGDVLCSLAPPALPQAGADPAYPATRCRRRRRRCLAKPATTTSALAASVSMQYFAHLSIHPASHPPALPVFSNRQHPSASQPASKAIWKPLLLVYCISLLLLLLPLPTKTTTSFRFNAKFKLTFGQI